MISISAELLQVDNPVGVVVVAVLDGKLSLEVRKDEAFELPFHKNVVIAMVDCRLLIFALYRSVNVLRVLRFRLLSCLCLFVSVVKMPWNEYILSSELTVLLLVSPDIHKELSTNFDDSRKLS